MVFWRHGRTAWNAAGRFQGQCDIALDDVGVAQAERTAALLAGQLAAQYGHAVVTQTAPSSEPEAGTADHRVRLLSSDLQRAAATAAALGAVTGHGVVVDARLRETYGGAWEGMSFEQIQRDFPQDVRRWQQDEPDARAGGGETRLEVAERMVAVIREAAAATPPGGTVIVATHGGAARVGLAGLLGLPPHLWRTLSGLSNCHWSVVEELQPAGPADGPQWKLIEHNVGTLPEPFEALESVGEPVED